MNVVKVPSVMSIIIEELVNVQEELRGIQELLVSVDNVNLTKTVLIMNHVIASIESVDLFAIEIHAELELSVKALNIQLDVPAITTSLEILMLNVLNKNHLNQDLNVLVTPSVQVN